MDVVHHGPGDHIIKEDAGCTGGLDIGVISLEDGVWASRKLQQKELLRE